MKKALQLTGVLSFLLAMNGCGGSRSDDSRVLFEGTLTEAGGAHHEERTTLYRHSEGTRIGEVEICGLGQCSTTDDEGQWGFVAPDEFTSGDVLLTVNGHGIASSVVVNIPSGTHNAFLELAHVDGGKIEAVLSIDGEEVEHEHP